MPSEHSLFAKSAPPASLDTLKVSVPPAVKFAPCEPSPTLNTQPSVMPPCGKPQIREHSGRTSGSVTLNHRVDPYATSTHRRIDIILIVLTIVLIVFAFRYSAHSRTPTVPQQQKQSSITNGH